MKSQQIVRAVAAYFYRVIDMKTGQQVGANYLNVSRARARRDKLDLQYGAIRYRVERAA